MNTKKIRTINLGDCIGKVDMIADTVGVDDSCSDCYIRECLGRDCVGICHKITGVACIVEQCHFIKHLEYHWTPCTSNNLEVGDTVREVGSDLSYKVAYMLNHDDSVLIEFDTDNPDNDDRRCDFELIEYIEIISNLERRISL